MLVLAGAAPSFFSSNNLKDLALNNIANLIVELVETGDKLVEQGWTPEEVTDYLHRLLTEATQTKKKG